MQIAKIYEPLLGKISRVFAPLLQGPDHCDRRNGDHRCCLQMQRSPLGGHVPGQASGDSVSILAQWSTLRQGCQSFLAITHPPNSCSPTTSALASAGWKSMRAEDYRPAGESSFLRECGMRCSSSSEAAAAIAAAA